jgi:hypothetical protein
MKKKLTFKIGNCLHCLLWDVLKAYSEVRGKDRSEAIAGLCMVLGDIIADDRDPGDVRTEVIEVLDAHIAYRKGARGARITEGGKHVH